MIFRTVRDKEVKSSGNGVAAILIVLLIFLSIICLFRCAQAIEVYDSLVQANNATIEQPLIDSAMFSIIEYLLQSLVCLFASIYLGAKNK